MIGTHTGPGLVGVTALPVGPARPRLSGRTPRPRCEPPGVSAPAAAPSPTPVAVHPRRSSAIVLTVVACVLALYLIYLLRKPLTWIFIAGFLAIALSGPGRLPASAG